MTKTARAYAIRLSSGWIEIRVTKKQLKLVTTSTPRKWKETVSRVVLGKERHGVDIDGLPRYRTTYKTVQEEVEKCEKLVLKHVEGGIPLCCIPYNTWCRTAYVLDLPTPSEDSPVVRLPETFLSRKWRNDTFGLDKAGQQDV